MAKNGEIDLKALVRTIPDYPKAGIMFRDITTLIGDAAGFALAVRKLAAPYHNDRIDAVAGIEARGFILGGAVADRLGTGFIPIRKKGKLPWRAIGQDYQLEYGTDIIEMHEDAVRPGERVLIVDDLIATGRHGGGGGEADPARGRACGGGGLRDRPAGAWRLGAADARLRDQLACGAVLRRALSNTESS